MSFREPNPKPDSASEKTRTEAGSTRKAEANEAAPELPFVAAGHYRPTHEHARGGLGRVLAALDQVLLRPVAIKELLAPGPQTRARFVREAMLTARLQHPAIVPIYQAGRWPNGEPFYAMRLVAGRSLKEAIESAGSARERLALVPHVTTVADAVAYAHNLKIIHRDLKPSNVVLGEFGETVVIDWGIAKDLASAESDAELAPENGASEPGMTVSGSVLGTPQYMPPEQARGEPVDERADVYALGAMLYHVLSGRTPYDAESSSAAPFAVLKDPPRALASIEPSVPPELAGITARAMARAPADRYPSARAFAEDLRRFQAGQLVGSYRYSPWTLLMRWLRRHQLPVALSSAFVVALATLGALSVARITRERTAAEDRRNHVVLLQARSTLEHDPAATLAWLKSYPIESGDFREVRSIFEEARGRAALAIVPRALAVSAVGAKFRILRDDGSALDYDPASGQSEVHRLGTIPEHLECAEVSRTGLVAISDRHGYTVFDPDHGTQKTFPLPRDLEQFYGWCLFSANGRWLGFGLEGGLGWLDLRSGEFKIFRALGAATNFALSDDGQTLVWSGSPIQAVHVVHLATGTTEEWATPGQTPTWVSLRRDGESVSGFITGTYQGHVQIWSKPGALEREVEVCPYSILDARLLHDQTRLLVSCQEGSIKLLDLRTGALRLLGSNGHGRSGVPETGGDPEVVYTVGAELATAWNLATGVSATVGSRGMGRSGSVSSDGAFFAVDPSSLGEARIFRAPPMALRALPGHDSMFSLAAFSPDGKSLLHGRQDGMAICDAHGDACRVYPLQRPNFAAFSHDGKRVAFETNEESGWLELASGVRHLFGTGSASGIAWSPDDRQLVSYDNRHQLVVADVANLEGADRVHLRVVDQGTQALSLSWSPDGARLMWLHGMEAIEILELKKGESAHPQELREGQSFTAVAFARSGRSVIAAAADGTLWIWDTLEAKPRLLPHWFEQELRALAVSPDGLHVATASSDGRVRLLDLESGASDSFFAGAAQNTVRFSPEGRTLASGGSDGKVWLYDLATGDLHLLSGHEKAVTQLSFSPAGDRLASSSLDRELLWEVGHLPPRLGDARALRAAIDHESTVVLDAQDRPITPLP